MFCFALFWKLLRRNNLSIVITHFFSFFFPFLGVKCSLNKFSGVISLKIENAPRWKLVVHEIIESSFVDRIMMICQRKEPYSKNFVWIHMCNSSKCQYQQKFAFHPSNVTFQTHYQGIKKFWQRNWFEITILWNVSFQFVNSSFNACLKVNLREKRKEFFRLRWCYLS